MIKLSQSQVAMLDFIRGLSALTVLFGHVISRTSWDTTFGKYYAWQSLAVVVFFWLSGFLIAYNVTIREKYSFGEYMIDRFSRIYVLFVPALIFSFVVGAYLHGVPTLSTTVANLFMLQHTPWNRIYDVLPAIPVLGGNSPLWTVAIEWWLYVSFGCFAFFGRSGAMTRVLIGCLAVPALLVVGYFSIKEYVAWTWVAGAISAVIFVRVKLNRSSVYLALFLALLGFAVRINVLSIPAPNSLNMYDLQLMGFLTIILFCSVTGARGVYLPPAFINISARLAFISYSLYLTHEPISQLFYRQFSFLATDGVTYMHLSHSLIVVVVCMLVAAILAALLEKKHLKVRAWIKSKFAILAYASPKIRANDKLSA
jgi:peptidoglycan/LPS O-acetylase OafA/YrhL